MNYRLLFYSSTLWSCLRCHTPRAKRLLSFLLTLLVFVCKPVLGLPSTVDKVTFSSSSQHTQLIFDISRPTQPKVFSLSHPERVVVDFPATELAADITVPRVEDHQVKRLRTGGHSNGVLRVVLDLKRQVTVVTSVHKSGGDHRQRVVLSLTPKQIVKEVKLPAEVLERKKVPKSQTANRVPAKTRKAIVVLDPGHGGMDPGAIGRRHKTYEARVMMALARAVKQELDKSLGISVVLTRSQNTFVHLSQRRRIARQAKADLFISLHADSFHDPRVGGASVYVLSRNGASSEAAQWLANRANKSDLVGGVSVNRRDPEVVEVLLDLSMHAKLSASVRVAGHLIKALSRVSEIHQHQVQRARFHVLKAPDIPSVLVETAFISNPKEEQRLRSSSHRTRLAKAIAKGVVGYFNVNPPPGTLFAARQHIITDGETLSHIAMRYDISVQSLRRQNRLTDDVLRIGQTLLIPPSSRGIVSFC